MTRSTALSGCAALFLLASPALAQAPTATGIWPLFVQSFDFFTVILLAGSVAAGAFIFRCLIEVRPGAILPADRVKAATDMIKQGRFGELKGYVDRDRSFVGQVLSAAMNQGEVARVLVARGASTRAKDKTGKTPVDDAQRAGHYDLCDILD